MLLVCIVIDVCLCCSQSSRCFVVTDRTDARAAESPSRVPSQLPSNRGLAGLDLEGKVLGAVLAPLRELVVHLQGVGVESTWLYRLLGVWANSVQMHGSVLVYACNNVCIYTMNIYIERERYRHVYIYIYIYIYI